MEEHFGRQYRQCLLTSFGIIIDINWTKIIKSDMSKFYYCIKNQILQLFIWSNTSWQLLIYLEKHETKLLCSTKYFLLSKQICLENV